MLDLDPTPSFETEARLMLNGAKSLIRAIRNRERHADGMNYLDMEADSLEETIVNLFGIEHRGPAAPAIVAPARRTPPAHSRRLRFRSRHFATVAA